MADTKMDLIASIYEGIWTDWSYGEVWGLTWTLRAKQAIILTNALAIFVTVCGVQLWTILRYALYHMGTSALEANSPHLQRQQKVLRNATSDLATAQLMLDLAWNHRRSTTGKRSLRSYSIGSFAVIYAVLFWTAGIFSNKAISTSSTNGPWSVLSRSDQCGVWNQTYYDIIQSQQFMSEEELTMRIQFGAKDIHEVQLSLEYAQECYFSPSIASKKSSTCGTFKTSNLNWTSSDGFCPFASDICHHDSEVVVLDTGDIDSHNDLGINADPKDRLKYRRITTCSVLNDTTYITGWDGTIVNASSPRPPSETAYANYGASDYKDTNWTYSYSNFASFYDPFSSQVTSPYQVDVEQTMGFAEPQWTSSDFEPIKELAQDHADLNLLFLSFTGMYLQPIDDPWFSANRPQSFNTTSSLFQNRYARDRAISTIGCTEQHRFCTGSGMCTEFLGFDQVQNNATFSASLTQHQNATFDRMLRAVTNSRLGNVVNNLAFTTNPLLASNETYFGKSGAVVSRALPSNQWTLEMKYWQSIAMAHFQRTLFQWATGQIAPEPQYVQYLLPPPQAQDVWFCNNFIVQSAGYQSFSLVAIILIVILGILMVVGSLYKESFATMIVTRCFKKPAPSRKWEDDDMLVQRSPLKPQPPPKDDCSPSDPRARTPAKVLEMSDITSMLGIHRISSPTLPPEDRAWSILDHTDTVKEPITMARGSWLAGCQSQQP